MSGTMNLRALIVDDQEDDVLLIVLELERHGYIVEYKRVDTEEGMSRALDAREWDIVLSDHSMPRFDSLSALHMLQSKGIDIPFIIVSFAIGEELAVQAMKAGAHDYVMKGKMARLGPAVERELREAETRREKARMECEREALIKELRASVDQIKALQGLLPICSMCKKVRDDSGYWLQLESFLQKCTGAEFSHSYCPDCAAKALNDVEARISNRQT